MLINTPSIYYMMIKINDDDDDDDDDDVLYIYSVMIVNMHYWS